MLGAAKRSRLRALGHTHFCSKCPRGSSENCYVVRRSMSKLIERTPPPRGVFYLLCSLIKNPEEEDSPQNTWYKFFEGGPLPLA